MTNFHPKIQARKIVITAYAMAMTLFLTASVMSSVSQSCHDFRVTLCPERHLLAGLDRLMIKIASVPVLPCGLSSEANVQVDAPEGIIGVTAGRSLGQKKPFYNLST
jgi:hypothetical protein